MANPPPKRPSETTLGTAAPANRIRVDFNGADAMEKVGPLIEGSWSMSPVHQHALLTAGHPVPRPIPGVLLIDTGARGSCVALDVADQLGLQPHRLAQGLGAGGRHVNPVFYAQLNLTFYSEDGRHSRAIHFRREVQGIHSLKHALPPNLRAKKGQLHPRLIGLLGRDVLRYTTFAYHGPEGYSELILDIDAASNCH